MVHHQSLQNEANKSRNKVKPSVLDHCPFFHKSLNVESLLCFLIELRNPTRIISSGRSAAFLSVRGLRPALYSPLSLSFGFSLRLSWVLISGFEGCRMLTDCGFFSVG